MDKKFSKDTQSIKERLKNLAGKELTLSQKEELSAELASHLLQAALRIQNSQEKKVQKELAKMMQDPSGKYFTLSMTDQCFRSQYTYRVADQLIYLLTELGIPSYLSLFKQSQLFLFKYLGKRLHSFLVPLAKRSLRKTTTRLILPGEQAALSKHMLSRRKEGVRLNLNRLGEAIFGEKEALHRLSIYLHDLQQPDIEYISIKISTIFSQISPLNWDHSIEILSNRLRQLYRQAKAHYFTYADGTQVPKFVNLDMEEYRDLHLTKEVFKKILNEEEFFHFSAGIVLQAYIPDSYNIQQELTQWAMHRRQRGGAPIKIRIVKGANLAMEQVEASLHRWPQTPYKSKLEVDANYKRMLCYGCQKMHADAVHLGIASHNLFDLTFALITCYENQVKQEVTFEMLEGMANHLCRVIHELSDDILLYCPVARQEDFLSAIAYLVRRLDENTGPDNFLRHSFGLLPHTLAWEKQIQLFKNSCELMHTLSSQPRRLQNRFHAPVHLEMQFPFKEEPDTDFSLPQNQKWTHYIVESWQNKKYDPLPLVINGREIHRELKGQGISPSRPNETLYEFSLATWEDLDQALATAKAQESKWRSQTPSYRYELLSKIGKKMREKRDALIGAMMADGGKSIVEADPEVSEAIDFAEYYLRSMRHFEQMKELAFSPLGTILVTPPWNFPVSIPAGGILAALVTGNCVLFKPAPEAVLSGWVLVNLFWDAGVPKDVLQFINCVDDPIGSQLIKDSRINSVILTGGTPTARLFMRMSPSLHLCAETGGKNAFIITNMSDRDLALKCLVQSAFGHSGQKCSAASLAILEAEVYDDPLFMKQLQDAVESLYVGSNWNLGSKIIPLIHPPTGSLLKGITSLEEGESWLVEPKQDPHNPHLFSPGVKLGVKKGSFMHQTELFGPVLAVMRAQNLKEALDFANSTAYGLTSGIHSLDPREIQFWIDNIEAGNCYVNRTITGAIVQRQPFGGCKASSFGYGSKAGGPNYLLQFLHKKQLHMPHERLSFHCKHLETLLNTLALSPEDVEILTASLENYNYWKNYFQTDHDPSQVIGQDNFLRYVPRKKLALRLQEKDSLRDLLRALAAAHLCKTSLTVSYSHTACLTKNLKKWKRAFPLCTFVQEEEETFLNHLEKNLFEKVRLLSPPSDTMTHTAALNGIYLNKESVLATGRLELLHYLREVALSIDYHRYGNLGLREGEERSEIL